MQQSSLLATAACVATLGVASAQSLNVDVGITFPVPASTFGAAAGQPGVWSSVDPFLFTPTALVDLAGAPTGATIQRTNGFGVELAFNHPGTSGDDEALLDDGDDPGISSTWTISGLTAGDYAVTTYAWAPDNAQYLTGVVVNGGPQTVVGGLWQGGYVLGVTHALHTIALAPGADVVIEVSMLTDPATFNGVQIRRLPPPIVPSCPGDGSIAPCPCGNSGNAGHGCANSAFAAGGLVSAAGAALVTADTLVLSGATLTGTSAVFFQGDALVAPIAIDDGLGCVGGAIVRLGTKGIAGNASSFPQAGDPSISVRGALPLAGGTRHYQCFYRNAAPLFCTPATSNRTNGVSVTWSP